MPSSACQTCALRSEEHTSELQSPCNIGCRLLLEKKKQKNRPVAIVVSAMSQVPALLLDTMRHSEIGNRGFFFNDTATTEIYTLSLHDALPISKPTLSTCFLVRCPGHHLIVKRRL